MAKRGKKYRKVVQKVDKAREYKLSEALSLIKNLSYSKFPGTIELHISINIPKDKDPKSIKGSVALPHAKAKKVRVAVAVPPELEEKAKEAGADIYKLDDLIKQVQEGKINFDVLIAVPQAMPKLAPLGKVLGPRGLMPNPKSGTVTDVNNLKKTIEEFKKGKLVFKADSAGGIHVPVGKITDKPEDVIENIKAVISAIVSIMGRSKDYLIKRIYLAPTMGPALRVDVKDI